MFLILGIINTEGTFKKNTKAKKYNNKNNNCYVVE